MKKRLVISRDALPAEFPTGAWIAVFLLLDRLHAYGWVWGVLGALCVFEVIGFIVGCLKKKSVDIFLDGCLCSKSRAEKPDVEARVNEALSQYNSRGAN